jgi:Icc-related predicted phosphoesterase
MKIAAIGDIHAHENKPHEFRELFSQISQKADVLLLCGDLTDSGFPDEARMLAYDLQSCSIPVFGVLGNHDFESGKQDAIKDILRASGFVFLDEKPQIVHGIGFAGVKGFGGGFGRYLLTAFGEPAVKQFIADSVSEALHLGYLLDSLKTEKMVVALHYAPIPETVRGEPIELYPFLGSSHLADTIDRFPASVVFHGHAHHARRVEYHTQKGVPVYNVSHNVLKTVRNIDYLLVEI